MLSLQPCPWTILLRRGYLHGHYMYKIWLVQITSWNEAFTCLESGSTTQVTACRRQAAERFIITVQFTSSPHCLKLRVSHWSAEFQFQRDVNVAGAHEPSILCQEHSPEVRRPECYADNSHPSSAEIKIFWDACCHVTPTHTRSGVDNRSPHPWRNNWSPRYSYERSYSQKS